MARIFWSQEEHEQIYHEACRLVKEGEADIIPYEIVRKAQKVLPKHRQREIKGTSSVSPELTTMLSVLPKLRAEHILHLQERVAATDEAPAPQPESQEPQPQLPTMLDLAAQLLSRLLTHPDVRDAVATLSRAAMSAVLEEKQVDGLFSATELRRLHEPEKPPSRAGLPVVLMLGFKPDQRAPFERRYADAIRFKWWYGEKGGEGLGLLNDKARMADAVFATMEACSHQAVEHAQTGSGRKVYRVMGGSQAMMRELDLWLAKREGTTIIK